MKKMMKAIPTRPLMSYFKRENLTGAVKWSVRCPDCGQILLTGFYGDLLHQKWRTSCAKCGKSLRGRPRLGEI
jgi:ribosomal protein S27AE